MRQLLPGSLLLLCALPCGAAAAGVDAPPAPDLSALEPVVAQQLIEVRELTLAALSDATAPAEQRAAAWGELGRLYHAYELFSAATPCYERAMELDPEERSWVYFLGHLAVAAGDLDRAAGHFSQALLGAPNDLALLIHLADAESGRNQLPAAREALQRALAVAPEDPVVWARLGELALAEGDYQQAVSRLTAVLEAVPQATRLHYVLGLAYRGLGDLEQARKELALRGEVGLAPSDERLAALAELQVGERVHLLRGRKAHQAGSYRQAAAEFSAAVEAKPDSVRARVNLSASLAALGDAAGAREQLLQAVALDATNATARFNLARLLAADGQHQLATQHFSRVVGSRPEDEEAWIGEAKSWIALGDFEKAVERLSTANAINPRSGVVAFGLARLLAAAPDHTVRNGQHAFELASKLFEIRQTAADAGLLATALRELGRCQEAVELLEETAQRAEQHNDLAGAESLRRERAVIVDLASCRP